MTDLVKTLPLQSQLDAAAAKWGKTLDYKTLNPADVAADLKTIFKGADLGTMTSMVQAKIQEIGKDNGRPRLAQRVNLGLQSLTA